jgi:hypothetical protein
MSLSSFARRLFAPSRTQDKRLNLKAVFLVLLACGSFESKSLAVQGVLICRNAQHPAFALPIPGWLQRSTPAYEGALKRGDHQALFESQVFGKQSERKIESEHDLVARLLEMLEIQRAENPEETRFVMPVIGYGNERKSRLVGLLPGEAPRRGHSIFPGLYPVKAYYRLIADGKYPIGDVATPVTFFGLDMREETAHHGLAHYGGFYASREYSDFSIRLAKEFVNQSGKPEFDRQRFRFGFFAESLWFPDSTQTQALHRFLESLGTDLTSRMDGNISSLQSALNHLPDSQIQSLAQKVISELPDIAPLGGGSRDYSEKQSLLDLMDSGTARHIQNQAASGYRLLTDLSLRESVQFQQLQSAIAKGDLSSIRTLLSMILTQAHLMPQTQMRGWYEASIGNPTEEAKKVLAFVCRSGVYNESSAIFRIYCK